jgi:hypothetical protein
VCGLEVHPSSLAPGIHHVGHDLLYTYSRCRSHHHAASKK